MIETASNARHRSIGLPTRLNSVFVHELITQTIPAVALHQLALGFVERLSALAVLLLECHGPRGGRR